MTINQLFTIIQDRIKSGSGKSYTFSLVKSGNDRVIQKVGEEAVEVTIAAKNNDRERLVSEVADLIYHLLVLMSVRKISLDDVYQELETRNHISLDGKI